MISQPCLFTNTVEYKAQKHYKMEESNEKISTIISMAAFDEKFHYMPIHLIFHLELYTGHCQQNGNFFILHEFLDPLNMTNNIQRESHPIPYWHLSCPNNNNVIHPI